MTEQTVLVLTTPTGTGERLREHLNQRGFEVRMALIDQPSRWQSLLVAAPPSAIVLDVSWRTGSGLERAEDAQG